MLSASTFSAALLLFPRSSGVGVGIGLATAVDKKAEQASTSARRIKAEAELRNAFPSRSVRGRLTEIWISVFIRVIVSLFVFGLSCLSFAILFPEIWGEVPRKFFRRPNLRDTNYTNGHESDDS